jgi:hypothetical protein
MKNKNLLIVAGVVIVGYLLLKKSQGKSLESRKKQMECDSRYSELMQPSVVMPQEYWDKRKEEWMKINCK